MAASSSSSSLLIFTVLSLSFLINPSISTAANCTSQTFSNNRVFDSCKDLPYLNSSLHWTYDASKSSVSLAFLARPPTPTSWIAWAINPTSKGMIGAQSLIAFRQSNGSMTVQTFDIKTYGYITQSRLSIQVSDLHSDFSDGVMRLFGTLVVPKNATTLNQLWQVGPSVTDGVPDKHALRGENLNAMGTLDLLQGKKEPPQTQQSNSTTISGGQPPPQQQQSSIPSSSPSVPLSVCASILSICIGILTLLSSV